MTTSEIQRGASAAAIREHYDVGNDFYRLWLDEHCVYSAALVDGEDDTLEAAQLRKIDHHIRCAHAAGAGRVLDIGCGWGATLHRLVEQHDVRHAVGLTLSDAQAEAVRASAPEGIDVRVESWEDHRPAQPYDGIISIGAMEHFVKPEHDDAERIAIYRRFFERCRAMLVAGGRLSLQTMVYGCGRWVPNSPVSRIFPESDMPHLHQLMSAIDGVFEVESFRNDRMHYAWTVGQWAARLQRSRDAAEAMVGPQVVVDYLRYLATGQKAHEAGVFLLLRLGLRAF